VNRNTAPDTKTLLAMRRSTKTAAKEFDLIFLRQEVVCSARAEG